jgi:hypothetical protein
MAEAMRASWEQDGRQLLPAVSVPTLVLHREGDRYVQLGAGRYMAEHIPNARFMVLPGDDHLFFSGDTDALMDEVEEFLTGARSGAESHVKTMRSSSPISGRALRSAADILAGAKDIGLDLRAGVHTGEVEVRGKDIAGLAVTIAKRVCDLAGPGQLLVSETVRGHMVGAGIQFGEEGALELKVVPGTWRLFSVEP